MAIPLGVGIAAVVILLDQITKQIAVELLDEGQFVPLLGEHVGWQLVYNPGGAFGLQAPSWFFLLVTGLVVVIVARALIRATRLFPVVAYGLLVAGALGNNAVDRVFRSGDPEFGGGHVVDFVAWGAFPRFNLADSAITVGFVLLVTALWQEERRHRAEEGVEEHPGTSGEPDEA